MSRPAPATRRRILAVADSDSYLKFACATLDRLGPGWDRDVVLVRTPLLPTPGQHAAAVSGTFMDGSLPRIVAVGRLRPLLAAADVVLAAATGPVAREVFRHAGAGHLRTAGARRRRPSSAGDLASAGVPASMGGKAHAVGGRTTALVSALPGLAYPATERALRFRSLGDAFITHSHAEARNFSALLRQLGSDQPVLTTRLPFLDSASIPAADPTPVKAVVFAAQAKFPFRREEREHILLTLARTRERHPGTDVVVKLRALTGEPQTHREEFPYDELWTGLVARGLVRTGSVRFVTGSMQAALQPGTMLVTVSSTAVLEALDRGLPAVVLADFGVGERLLNGLFSGSGLLGRLEDVEALRAFHPVERWMAENYFHTGGGGEDPGAGGPGVGEAGAGGLGVGRRGAGGLEGPLAELADLARAGRLHTCPGEVRLAGRLVLRARLRTVLPSPALRIIRRLRHRALPVMK